MLCYEFPVSLALALIMNCRLIMCVAIVGVRIGYRSLQFGDCCHT
jgi:hypothetical protein